MYLSNYTPEDYFQRMIKKIDEYGEETRMNNRFQKNDNGELVSLMIPVKLPAIQFRDSSNIQIQKKSCGCMSKKN